ncbi:hypothetical protein NPIL_290791, partial [Nephila pilipes]
VDKTRSILSDTESHCEPETHYQVRRTMQRPIGEPPESFPKTLLLL